MDRKLVLNTRYARKYNNIPGGRAAAESKNE